MRSILAVILFACGMCLGALAQTRLFAPDLLKTTHGHSIEVLERVLLARLRGEESADDHRVSIRQGTLNDIRALSDTVPCLVTVQDARVLTIEWDVPAGPVIVDMEIGYQTAKRGTRTEIENRLIKAMQCDTLIQPIHASPQMSTLEVYADSLLLVCPGDYYHLQTINRHIYYTNDTIPQPVRSTTYPLESFANMIMLGCPDSLDVPVELEVSVHEYGEKKHVTTTLNRLLAAMAHDGAKSYVGIESFDNGLLRAAIFFYNAAEGYDHVLRMECRPDDILSTCEAGITARAKLYIPTNNVDNLFEADAAGDSNAKYKLNGK